MRVISETYIPETVVSNSLGSFDLESNRIVGFDGATLATRKGTEGKWTGVDGKSVETKKVAQVGAIIDAPNMNVASFEADHLAAGRHIIRRANYSEVWA